MMKSTAGTADAPAAPGPASADARPGGSSGLALPFGDYVLEQEIAHGGMGIVYRARQITLNRTVAVKLLLLGKYSSAESVERFRREAQSAATLHHPNIVAIYEVGEHDGQHYFSMEFVKGRSLAEVLREGPLAAPRAAAVVHAVAVAIHYAHEQGVLHRDLKPSNVLLDESGQVRVTDFGLAKRLDGSSDLTVTGQMVGTPNYLSPEQAAGRNTEVGPASDVYSIGALLYELLTGRPPFLANSLQETLLRIRDNEPVALRVLNPAVPRDLETICLKCLEKEPARRYGSAAALAEDLRRWQKSEPIKARPVGPFERLIKWVRRQPRVSALMAVAALALLGLIVVPSWMSIRIAAANQQAQMRARESQERLIQLQLTTGLQAMKDGDLFGSLPWLVEALKLDSANPARQETHRARIAAVLDHSPRLVQILPHATNVAMSMFSPDGTRILVHSEKGGFAQIHDARNGQAITPRLQHSDAVPVARFNHCGNRVLTAGWDGAATIWDASTGRMLVSVAHDERLVTASFSPDDRRFLTVSMSPAARVCEADSGRLVFELRHESVPYDAGFSPDGRWIATGQRGKVCLWDAQTGRLKATLPMPGNDAARRVGFSPDSRRVQSGSGHVIQVWDVASAAAVTPPFSHPNTWIYGADFSPDNRTLLSWGRDATVRTWPLETNVTLLPLLRHEHGVRYTAFSPDGGRIVTVCDDQFVRIWDVQTGELVCSPLRHGDGNVRASFSPDGRQLLTTEPNQTRVWDLADAAEAGPELRIPHTRGLGFSADGTRLFTANHERNVQAWDIATGREVPVSEIGTPPRWPVLGSSVLTRRMTSPDGRRELTMENNLVFIRDARTRHPIVPALRHRETILCMAWSPDGRRVATGSADKTARVWDVETGLALTPPLRESLGVLHVVFSPDGRRLAIRDAGGGVRVWDLRVNSWPIADLEALAGLLSGRGVDAAGALADVAMDNVRDAWNRLSAAYPGEFSTTSEQRNRWHWRNAVRALLQDDPGKSMAVLAAGADRTRLLWQGRIHISGTNWEKALSCFTEALRDQPQNTVLRREQARCFVRLNRFDDAVRSLDEGLRIDPSDANLWIDRARCRIAAGEMPAALPDLDQAIRLAPLSAVALEMRADVGVALREWDRALADYLHARELRAQLPIIADSGATRVIPVRDERAPAECLDLSTFINAPLAPNWIGPDRNPQDLGDLAPGVRRLGGVDFDVRGVVQLLGSYSQHRTSSYPIRAAGIPIRRTCRRVHLLHATLGGAVRGTTLARAVFHFSGGAQVEQPIAFEADLGDAFARPRFSPSGDRTTIAWKHDAPGTHQSRTLYRTTWENPRPDEQIVMLDYVSTVGGSSPFLVAVTVE